MRAAERAAVRSAAERDAAVAASTPAPLDEPDASYGAARPVDPNGRHEQTVPDRASVPAAGGPSPTDTAATGPAEERFDQPRLSYTPPPRP
jgi:hypothetical protein